MGRCRGRERGLGGGHLAGQAVGFLQGELWANELLYRHDEARLTVIEEGRPWRFDGDGALFRLVSEARGEHRVHYLRRPFQREPDFGVTSVNCDSDELIVRAVLPD